MRNLKRALSLTLASVMLLGMMVVGAGAAGYPDIDKEDNVEAIEVLQAVQVMRGDDNGNFDPDRPVTRSEMAVIMALLLNLDYDYYEASCPFWDVPTWARPYVGACYANKIVSGYGDGTYGAADTITAVQAASMMMRALGYFKYPSDYKDGFETATVRQGTKIDIFKGVGSKVDADLTRNQVAQMALNALKTPIVEPSDKTINITDGNGNLVASGGQVDYVVVASNQPYAQAIDRIERTGDGLNQVQGYTVELGEKLYNGKLKLEDDYDVFGRPARNWEFDGKNVGVYAKKELMVFENVGSVTGKDLYDLLGAKTIEDYALTVSLDGVSDAKIVRNVAGYDGDATDITDKHNVDFVFDKSDMNRNNKATVGATGTGVLTQVYVDHEADTIDIAVINTYLARADKNYDDKKEELSVTAYDLYKDSASGEYVKDIKNDKSGTQGFKLAVDKFPIVKDGVKNDSFLVTVADGEIQSVVSAEVLASVKISSFKKGDNVVVDGSTYQFANTTRFDAKALKDYTDTNGQGNINLKNLTYNIYLDTYGNLIGVEEVDPAKNYVFISAIDLTDSNLVNGTANARAIFLDGTVDTIRVNMGKSKVTPKSPYEDNSILNTWCTYTKTNSDVYTLTQVTDINARGDNYVPGYESGGTVLNKTGLAQYHETITSGELNIDKKHITLKGKTGATGESARVYGDDKTVYLTAELSELKNNGTVNNGCYGVISGVETLSTGIEATDLIVWDNAKAATEADDVKTTAYAPIVATASSGVYTLYNDDGVIIAAMVVGEDNGASKNLVYVHSGDVDFEAYDEADDNRASGDGLFTWSRKVISNGEEITLTEISEGNSVLARMQKYHWYQVKTNGEGELIAGFQLPNVDENGDQIDDGSDLKVAGLTRFEDLALDYHNTDVPETGDKKIGEIAYTVQNGKGTVLYHNKEFINSSLRMSNRTLYVATDDQTGFIVSKDVDYVLQQWNSNKKDTFVETGSGSDNLANVVKELNDRYGVTKDNGKTYTYQISAILENGVASSVVIYDNNNDYVRPGDPGTGTVGNISVASGERELVKNLGKDTKLDILASGNNTLTLEVEAPDWAEDVNTGSELSLDATLYMDGRAYERISGITAWTESSGTYTVTLTNQFSALRTAIRNLTIDPADHTFSVLLNSIEWTYAGVKYVLADGSTEVPGLTKTAGEKMAITSDDKAFSFTFSTTAAESAGYVVDEPAYAITGATLVKDETTKLADELDGSSPVTFGSKGIRAGNGWVTVTISGVEKDTEAPPTTDTFTVNSNDPDVLFAVVTGKTLAEVTAVPDDAVWAASVEAEENDIILVKSKTEGAKLTALGDAFDPEDGATVTLSGKADVNTNTGVFKFTMPAKNVKIKTVTTDVISVTKGTIKSDASIVNLLTDKDASGLSEAEKFELAIAYVNAKTSYTAEAEKDLNDKVTGMTINGKKVTTLNVGDNLAVVKVDGGEDVVAGADAATATVKSVLDLKGTAIAGAGANVFVILDKGASGKEAKATTTTGTDYNDAVLADVVDILTNSGNGYAKLNPDPAMAKGGTGVLNGTDAPTVAIKTECVTEASSAKFVKIGDTLSFVVTVANTQAAADNTMGATVEDNSSSGAVISDFVSGSIEKGKDIAATDTITVTLKIGAVTGEVAIKLVGADLS